MKAIITFSLCFFLSYFAKADTIPSWKIFYNSRFLKEIKIASKFEEIKIDSLAYNSGDYLDILYSNFEPSDEYIYDIFVGSESAVDLNITYNNQKALLQTESSVELFAERIFDKSKPIRIDLKWVIDWLKEYPEYRIQVTLEQRRKKQYSSTILFYIVNK